MKNANWMPEFEIHGQLDGPTEHAQFHNPDGIAIAPDGNMYVADTENDLIRRIDPAGEHVTTYVGMKGWGRGLNDGASYRAKLMQPSGITISPNGNIYFAEVFTQRIRLITPDRVVTTFVGEGKPGLTDGFGQFASFRYPASLDCDKKGNIYVADKYNHAIRFVTPSRVVTTLAGGIAKGLRDGSITTALFFEPRGVAVGEDGRVYVSDFETGRIRMISKDNMPQTPGQTADTMSLEERLSEGMRKLEMEPLSRPDTPEWDHARGYRNTEQHVGGANTKNPYLGNTLHGCGRALVYDTNEFVPGKRN
mmetsp:Transcript_10135/g.18446  ORF Transcript_10135/g.18446 Transcript_10135/m.18446 type:complete len:307 (+) Transcript_10135:237-1157(+)